MDLQQYIYSSTLAAETTPQMAYDLACRSVAICQSIGITGRVFANRREALAMTEGPAEIVAQYFRAVSADPLVENILLHVDRAIPSREFTDYSVWLNLGAPFRFGGQVHKLTPGTVRLALPKNPSARLRIMAEAYLDESMLVA